MSKQAFNSMQVEGGLAGQSRKHRRGLTLLELSLFLLVWSVYGIASNSANQAGLVEGKAVQTPMKVQTSSPPSICSRQV
ncbi:MAG: hypothetical protein ACR2HX_17410 [Pyrinomonadaceae bacterium]